MKENSSYTLLAPFYDRLMKTIDYRGWAEYVHNVTEPFLEHPPIVLELASGTSSFAAFYKKHCRELFVSDKSIDMLVAGKMLPGRMAAFDMTKIPFESEVFDMCLCLFDSINYLTSQQKIAAAFREVYRVLKPGGLFLFDCCLLSGSLEHISKHQFSLVSSGIKVRQTSSLNAERMMHSNTFRFEFPGGKVVVETHKQKIYPLEVIARLVMNRGFTILAGYKNFTFQECKPEDKRVNFLVRKK